MNFEIFKNLILSLLTTITIYTSYFLNCTVLKSCKFEADEVSLKKGCKITSNWLWFIFGSETQTSLGYYGFSNMVN